MPVDLAPIIAGGTFEFRHVAVAYDGKERLIGYRPISPYPLVASSTVSVKEALAGWRRGLWLTGGMALVFSLAVYGLASVADRRQHVQASLAAELSCHRQRLEQEVQVRTRDLAALAQQLSRSNEELEQFAFVASHDLREPLRMVSAYLGLLERRAGDRLDEESREFVAYARDGAVRMDALIRDLLEYCRVGRQSDPGE
ncbi:MAG: hypothetical protein HY985_13925, partial [Magnetospirillum sp.]|nr:hypothetical protein [Magnetospirillum sp.]